MNLQNHLGFIKSRLMIIIVSIFLLILGFVVSAYFIVDSAQRKEARAFAGDFISYVNKADIKNSYEFFYASITSKFDASSSWEDWLYYFKNGYVSVSDVPKEITREDYKLSELSEPHFELVYPMSSGLNFALKIAKINNKWTVTDYSATEQ